MKYHKNTFGAAGARKVAGGLDFYETPEKATIGLLRNEEFPGTVWEPACGSGAISDVLQAKLGPNNVQCSDINPRGDGAAFDFLRGKYRGEMPDHIITNPPFNKAEAFLVQSKKYARKKVAFMLRLLWLESKKRYPMFHDKLFPLKAVYVFPSRLSMAGDRSGLVAFAWFVWDREWEGEPVIRWIMT